MALEILHRGGRLASHLVLFPGTWNPPTVAHVEIAQAALRLADEVVWILPRAFPHKNLEGAEFGARCAMLKKIAREQEGFSAAISDGGLYVDIAAEARAYFGSQTEISMALGRDAAERIATWDYGSPGVFDDLVSRHRLLVAARHGDYLPALPHRERIVSLPMAADWNEVSSSEVRRRVTAGEDWRHLVPGAIEEMVRNLYSEGITNGETRTAIGTGSAEREP